VSERGAWEGGPDKVRLEATSLFLALDESEDGSLSIAELSLGLARAGSANILNPKPEC
jgi:hypothetical protein